MKIHIILFTLVFLSSCSSKQQQGQEQLGLLDTIPMQYNQDLFIPALDAVVNDSLHFKLFFDTGQPGKFFAAFDDFRSKIGDSAYLQIGKTKMLMPVEFIGSNKPLYQLLNHLFGEPALLMGWEFFDNKIIEFSFENEYLIVHEKLPDITGYSKNEISRSGFPFLEIPIEFVLQGKIIKDTAAIIDTGNNSHLVISVSSELLKKYDINPPNGFRSLPIDTIKIGNQYVAAEQNMRLVYNNKKGPTLIGVRTLDNFSVILDLINYDLYLKKISNYN